MNVTNEVKVEQNTLNFKTGIIAGEVMPPAPSSIPATEGMLTGDRGLLLQAFEMFNQASSSLESAFSQLQARVQRLAEELEVKNIELEKSLREKEEAQSFLRTILERLPCGVMVLDKSGGLTLSNPMASEVLEQPVGNACKSGVSPSLSPEMSRFLSASVIGKAGKSEIEIPIVTGDRKRIIATSGTPLADSGGAVIGTLHILRDITEVKALQEQNQHIERLSAMGEMAIELAHEIRNPLGSIELFASLLAKEVSGDPARWADNIKIGVRTLNTIVFNMLHFANPISPDFSRVDAHSIIREMLSFAEPLMRQRDVRVIAELNSADSMITADPELLKQMMLNLIFNAMKAMPSKGSLCIRTRTFNTLDCDGGSKHFELQIADTGIGIPPENLNRIFDPFFTTNKNGTGLGLSVVHQIVEKHSGSIRVESAVNCGTTFTIVFKCASEKE